MPRASWRSLQMPPNCAARQGFGLLRDSLRLYGPSYRDPALDVPGRHVSLKCAARLGGP